MSESTESRVPAIMGMAFKFALKVSFIVWVNQLYEDGDITWEQKIRYMMSPLSMGADMLAGKFKGQEKVEERWAEYEIIKPLALSEKSSC